MLKAALDDIFDQALVSHGFTNYMRDDELISSCSADPITGIAPEHLRYVFTFCVVAEAETALAESSWGRSMDERLINYESGVNLDGYVWGVTWQMLCPGAHIVQDSERAGHWTTALNRDFHEVRVETNGHNLTLVFSELEVSKVEQGYAPFTGPNGGPDVKIPFDPPPAS